MRGAAQPVEPAECRAACCATFCKSPNLSGPRLCRSPVEAAESPAARRPGQPAHLQRRVRSDQLRSRQRQPHSPSVHQQRHRLGRGQAQAGGRRPAPPRPPSHAPPIEGATPLLTAETAGSRGRGDGRASGSQGITGDVVQTVGTLSEAGRC